MSPLHPTPDGSVKNSKGSMAILTPILIRSISLSVRGSSAMRTNFGYGTQRQKQSILLVPVRQFRAEIAATVALWRNFHMTWHNVGSLQAHILILDNILLNLA